MGLAVRVTVVGLAAAALLLLAISSNGLARAATGEQLQVPRRSLLTTCQIDKCGIWCGPPRTGDCESSDSFEWSFQRLLSYLLSMRDDMSSNGRDPPSVYDFSSWLNPTYGDPGNASCKYGVLSIPHGRQYIGMKERCTCNDGEWTECKALADLPPSPCFYTKGIQVPHGYWYDGVRQRCYCDNSRWTSCRDIPTDPSQLPGKGDGSSATAYPSPEAFHPPPYYSHRNDDDSRDEDDSSDSHEPTSGTGTSLPYAPAVPAYPSSTEAPTNMPHGYELAATSTPSPEPVYTPAPMSAPVYETTLVETPEKDSILAATPSATSMPLQPGQGSDPTCTGDHPFIQGTCTCDSGDADQLGIAAAEDACSRITNACQGLDPGFVLPPPGATAGGGIMKPACDAFATQRCVVAAQALIDQLPACGAALRNGVDLCSAKMTQDFFQTTVNAWCEPLCPLLSTCGMDDLIP